MIRPTRRAILLFAAGIPIALIAIAVDAGNWRAGLYYSMFVILVILADASMAVPVSAIAPRFGLPERLYIGESGVLYVAFGPFRYRRNVGFEIRLEQRGEAENAGLITAELSPQGDGMLSIPIVPLRRGVIHLDRLWLRWESPYRLAQLSTVADIDGQVPVVPNVRGAQRAELHIVSEDALFGEKVQHRGEGAEFEALREYTPGLDTRFIDWKHSARHSKLVCKEFRTERNHPVVLAFDTGHLMIDPLRGIPRLDHAINAALRLSWIALRSGDLVGVFGFDARLRHYTQPVRGARSFRQVQRATADLAYHTEETNFTLGLAELNARLKRRALVIVFTDFIDTTTSELLIESMHRIASKHVPVFVTFRDGFLRETAEHRPESFDHVARSVIAQDFLQERSIVLERLSRIGVHCLDVPSTALPVTLINRYLDIKRRGLI
jgi:uncharacterized protein (DUF58 family)